MDPNAAAALAEKGILGILLLVAMGTVVFLFLRLEKKQQEKDAAAAAYIADLKAEHAARLADKDKAGAAVLEQSNRAHNLVDRLTDVFEAMTGKKIQP